MEATKDLSSPFYTTGVFGHNPFERHGEVYRINPTVTTVEKVLELLTQEEISFLKSKSPAFFTLPSNRPILIGIVDKVYDDPLLGGVKAKAPEAEEQAKEINEWLTDMNGVEFHRQYYQFMVKDMYEGMVRTLTGGKITNPDQFENDDFFYTFIINFFARYFIGKEKLYDSERVKFFEKVFDDMNAFDYVFLGDELPKDRTNMHFLVWEK